MKKFTGVGLLLAGIGVLYLILFVSTGYKKEDYVVDYSYMIVAGKQIAEKFGAEPNAEVVEKSALFPYRAIKRVGSIYIGCLGATCTVLGGDGRPLNPLSAATVFDKFSDGWYHEIYWLDHLLIGEFGAGKIIICGDGLSAQESWYHDLKWTSAGLRVELGSESWTLDPKSIRCER